MANKKETAAPNVSVGADTEQPPNVNNNSITNYPPKNNSKALETQNKRMNGYSLIAIQLFGEFVNGI